LIEILSIPTSTLKNEECDAVLAGRGCRRTQ
jgi:hypothetical protein